MPAHNELLLIEDDPVTREVLTLLLSDDGWRVHEVEHGEAALALLQTMKRLPRVVLCDQNLPGISGGPLAARVRQVYESADSAAPVLLAMTATRAKEIAAYDATLIKPFTAASVRDAIESATRTPDQAQGPGALDPFDRGAASILPVIEESVFLNLKKSMGNERLRAMYLFATTDAAERLHSMEAAQKSADLQKVTSEAHMLKGAAGMIGARRLASLAEQIEALDATGDENGEILVTKLVMVAAALADIPHKLETLFSVHP